MTLTIATLDPDAIGPTLDAEQLAEILGVRVWTVYKLVREGTCPVPPLRVGRKIRFSTAETLRYVGITPAA